MSTLRTPIGTYSESLSGGPDPLRYDVPFFAVRQPPYALPACVGELVQVQLKRGQWINLRPGELNYRVGMARVETEIE